jgi:hypothetical protein
LRFAKDPLYGEIAGFHHIYATAGFVHWRLISKWGGFPVYDHRLEEVPASYGDEVKFFEAPSEGIGLEWFLEYARATGLSDAEIAEAKSLAQHNLRPMKRPRQGTAIPDPA